MQGVKVPSMAQANGVVTAMRTARAKATTATQANAASSATSSSSSTGSGATGNTITANDFLTLLVAEMKNQDPTSNTDPNAYINQLVQVNSLQQLISINQKVGATGSSSSLSSPSSSPSAVASDTTTGRHGSPMQAMTNFAATLRGEPAAPSMESRMAASARRVASAL